MHYRFLVKAFTTFIHITQVNSLVHLPTHINVPIHIWPYHLQHYDTKHSVHLSQITIDYKLQLLSKCIGKSVTW
jgi:hypothetical protein